MANDETLTHDARVLKGYMAATEGKDKTIGDACNALGWQVGRYLDALGCLMAANAI